MATNITITPAAWVQILPATATGYAIISDQALSGDLPPARVKWTSSAAVPALGETVFNTAGPSDQINGSTSEPIWALSWGPQDSVAVAHNG